MNPETFDFGQALKLLRGGKKVARLGWNGVRLEKNPDAPKMWIVLMPALYLESSVINGRVSKHLGEGKDLDSQPYLAMYTAEGKWQPGWLASQADLLSSDWTVVD